MGSGLSLPLVTFLPEQYKEERDYVSVHVKSHS